MSCPVGEIFAGGARGGGKTDGVVGRFGVRALAFGSRYRGLIFRQELPQADDLIDRALEVWSPFGSYGKQARLFTFHNGATIRFRSIQRVSDAQKYQGQNIVDAAVDEAGNYPDPAPIRRLHGVLRSKHGLPTSLVMSGNPGGPGHAWLKQRFVDPAPEGMRVLRERIPATDMHPELINDRIFIPGLITENKILLEGDPSYIGRLHNVGSESLVRAWLRGDWNAIEGAFFDRFDSWVHGIDTFPIPEHWTRFRSVDWGFSRPFSVGWWAVASEDYTLDDGSQIQRGALIRYREWYGCKRGQPNTGLRLNADEVAKNIVKLSKGDPISYTVADPAMWGTQSGPSIAEQFNDNGVLCRRADNKRVPQAGSVGGWNQMRFRIDPKQNGGPAMYFFRDACKDALRLIPTMLHDEKNPEDIDTNVEDHIADEVRYACMSRPWTAETPIKSSGIETAMGTMEDVLGALH